MPHIIFRAIDVPRSASHHHEEPVTNVVEPAKIAILCIRGHEEHEYLLVALSSICLVEIGYIEYGLGV